ncbi:MAG TPA: alpha/beta hydrolase [Gemmatimonadaceae bacterium]|nr:alpha/beta hydrolase [Gemmatimonadaceae bacterium]
MESLPGRTLDRSAPALDPAAREFLAWLAVREQRGDDPPSPHEVEGAGSLVSHVEKRRRRITTPVGTIDLTILRPAHAPSILPAILYLHGGGWRFGDERTHEWLIAELATRARAALVFVHYALSHEAQHPVALEQAYAALEWMASEGPSEGIRCDRIAIAGDSAGGNMAAVVSMLAAARGGPSIRQQVLFYPMTDALHEHESVALFARGFYLTAGGLRDSVARYAPDAEDRRHWMVSPLHASECQLSGSPPTLIITAGFDPLRDEGERFGERLSAAGVPVVTTRYPGMLHAFLTLRAMARSPAPKIAAAQAAFVLRGALHPADSEPLTGNPNVNTQEHS